MSGAIPGRVSVVLSSARVSTLISARTAQINMQAIEKWYLKRTIPLLGWPGILSGAHYCTGPFITSILISDSGTLRDTWRGK
jgi:hypothetical protein